MQNHITVVIGEGASALHYARIEDGYVVCGANADRSQEQFLARYSSGGGFCIHCAAAEHGYTAWEPGRVPGS